MDSVLVTNVYEAHEQGRRLVAPLLGFPGLEITGGSIKVAQQNYGEHFRVVKALAERFSPDLVFPLMDLSVEANALGRYTVFPQEDSATVPKESFDFGELSMLEEIDICCDTRLMGYVRTMELMSRGLPAGVLRGAYVTGPYSLAALILGADEAAMATVIDPERLKDLCELAARTILNYARLLIDAGAQVICILEPTAVMLGPDQFSEFSAAFVGWISRNCRAAGADTVYHVCGNTMHLIDIMAGTEVSGLSLDSSETGVDLAEVSAKLPADMVLLGGISPTGTIQHGTPAKVAAETESFLRKMDCYPNLVLSTGCDLPQKTPLENIGAFVQTGRDYRCHRRHRRLPTATLR